MNDVPKTFVSTPSKITKSLLKNVEDEAIDLLDSKGYEVLLGLSEEYAKDIAKMCQQDSIKEYCPNDYGRRFTSLEATSKWLSKGRAVFLLVKQGGNREQLIGYGWAGAEPNPEIPGSKSTFALRIGEEGQGQGLATQFAQIIVSGAVIIYGAESMWLETWESNQAAVHIYTKLGFSVVKTYRSTWLKINGQEVGDNRLLMTQTKN